MGKDIRKFALSIIKGTTKSKDRLVDDHVELKEIVELLRSMGCIVVLTTGVWDLYHFGHAKYIEKGKEEAKNLFPDSEHFVIVVGVDSDKLAKVRKGSNRPFASHEERWEVLACQRAVDIVVIQDEKDQLIKTIPHDVWVISESTKDLPQEELVKFCTHVIKLPPQANTSSTAKIQQFILEGAGEVLSTIREQIYELEKKFTGGGS